MLDDGSAVSVLSTAWLLEATCALLAWFLLVLPKPVQGYCYRCQTEGDPWDGTKQDSPCCLLLSESCCRPGLLQLA